MNRIVRISVALTAVALVALTPPAIAHGQEEINPVAVVLGVIAPIGESISFPRPQNPFGEPIESPGGLPNIEADVFTISAGPGINHDLVPPGVTEDRFPFPFESDLVPPGLKKNPGLWSSDGIDDPSATEGQALVAKFFIEGGAADTERYLEAFVGRNPPGLTTFPGDPQLTNDPVADLNNVIATRNDQGEISTNYDIYDGTAWNTFGNTATITWVWSEDDSTITMYIPNRQFESMGEAFVLTVFYGDLREEPSSGDFSFWRAEVTTDQVPALTVDQVSVIDEAVTTALATGQPLPAPIATPDAETTDESEPNAGGPTIDSDADQIESDGQPDGEADLASGESTVPGTAQQADGDVSGPSDGTDAAGTGGQSTTGQNDAESTSDAGSTSDVPGSNVLSPEAKNSASNLFRNLLVAGGLGFLGGAAYILVQSQRRQAKSRQRQASSQAADDEYSAEFKRTIVRRSLELGATPDADGMLIVPREVLDEVSPGFSADPTLRPHVDDMGATQSAIADGRVSLERWTVENDIILRIDPDNPTYMTFECMDRDPRFGEHRGGPPQPGEPEFNKPTLGNADDAVVIDGDSG